jgi:hypothetical protein
MAAAALAWTAAAAHTASSNPLAASRIFPATR